jgi:hypothetical protein
VRWLLILTIAILAIAGVFPEEAFLCALMGIKPSRIEEIGFVLCGANLAMLLSFIPVKDEAR